MKIEVIEEYFDKILTPKLSSLSIIEVDANRVISTVREQMLSCIYHWNDISFRNTILFIGKEEGTYYLPKVRTDIRNFVVVTLRNSALESIHADCNQYSSKSRIRLSSSSIREITAAALKYFRDVDFENISNGINPLECDIYGDLAKKYPMAWAAIAELANSDNNTITYNPVSAGKISALGISYGQPKLAKAQISSNKRSLSRVVVEDGYATVLNRELKNMLKNVVAAKIPLIVDGFKTLSRNVDILFFVIEYLLGNELMLVTTNYYISNGYVERRITPLKPGSTVREMRSNYLNREGISDAHRLWLEAVIENS